MADDIDGRVQALRSDREHGATELAKEALAILAAVAQAGDVDRIAPLARELAAARPAMAAIKNAMARVLGNPAALASPEAALDACRRVEEWMEYASEITVAHAASIIPEDAILVTCSYSSGVMRACARAVAEGRRRLRVRVMESLVSGRSYGQWVAAALREQGIATELVGDEGVEEALEHATLVLVGADRVVPSGALVNGTPSLALAQAAHGSVPFYALCEPFKMDTDLRLEPGFDLVPAGLVTAYITEKGVAKPSDVWAVHQRA